MAHVATAYIVMTYIGTTHIVMASLVTAHIVAACLAVAYISMACVGMAYVGMAYHAKKPFLDQKTTICGQGVSETIKVCNGRPEAFATRRLRLGGP